MSITLAPASAEVALVQEINDEYRQAESSWQRTAEHAIRCGQLLQQAKLELEHGNWTSWLTENFAGSIRTAQQYMQLAEAQRENPQLLDQVAEDSISAAVRVVARSRRQRKAEDDIIDAQVVEDETFTLTLEQLASLVKAFGGDTTEDRVRTWIERLSEPKMRICHDCAGRIIQAEVKGVLITADADEWEPRAACQSCLHTRRAHPGRPVSCARCGNTGYVGTDRPPGPMLAIDMAWGDRPHVRLIGEKTDRRKGEGAHPLHQCPATQHQEQAA